MSTPPLQASQSTSDTFDAFDRKPLDMLHRLGGDRLVGEMVSLFLRHGDERLRAARSGLDAADADGIRAAAHALKSSAGQLGAVRLQCLCAELESAVKQSLTGTGERLDAIEAELSRASRWLRAQVRSA